MRLIANAETLCILRSREDCYWNVYIRNIFLFSVVRNSKSAPCAFQQWPPNRAIQDGRRCVSADMRLVSCEPTSGRLCRRWLSAMYPAPSSIPYCCCSVKCLEDFVRSPRAVWRLFHLWSFATLANLRLSGHLNLFRAWLWMRWRAQPQRLPNLLTQVRSPNGATPLHWLLSLVKPAFQSEPCF